jgi:hypothetical protein
MNVVIFSKDRAPQLDLLLRSMKRFATHLIHGSRLSIIFTTTTSDFMRGYCLLFKECKDANWVREEKAFKNHVIDAVDTKLPHTLFLVDDDVFKAPWSPDQSPGFKVFLEDRRILCYSMRHYPGIVYCHPKDCKEVPPTIQDHKWIWAGQTPTWSYPMAVEGHVFRTAQILSRLRSLTYEQPNQLEAALNRCALRQQLPYMSCDDESAFFSVPANIVNRVCKNRNMGCSAEDLNRRWLDGKRIDLDPFVGYLNRAVHEEIVYRWVRAL